MVSSALNKLFSLFHLRARRANAPQEVFAKRYFIEYGGVKWKVCYLIHDNGTEEKTIKQIPYCKRCTRPFTQGQSINRELSSLICPSCHDTKKGYPLLTNYRGVLNLVDSQICSMLSSLRIENITRDE